MSDRKLKSNEIEEIIAVFNDVYATPSPSLRQSSIFGLSILFLNFYVLFFLLIFLAFKFGYLTPVEQALFDGPFSEIYSIRAYAQVFLLAAINITAYFRIGFKTTLLVAAVYGLNSMLSNQMILNLEFTIDRPILMIFLMSRPLYFIALVVAWFSFKDRPNFSI